MLIITQIYKISKIELKFRHLKTQLIPIAMFFSCCHFAHLNTFEYILTDYKYFLYHDSNINT